MCARPIGQLCVPHNCSTKGTNCCANCAGISWRRENISRKPFMKRRALLQILVLLLFALPKAKGANDGPSRTGDDLFAKANTEFAAGNFQAAIADYQAVVDSGEWSANLFYDLGNAYFRHG